MIHKKTNLILVASVFTTILAIMVFIFFFRIIENKNKHISATLSVLEDKMLEKENAQILKDRIIEIENIHNDIKGHILNEESMDVFVGYLEELGDSVGTKISVKSIDAVKNEKNLTQIKINILGNFSGVMKSISLVENMPYKIDIIEIYLNKDLVQNSQNNIDENTNSDNYISGWSVDISFNVKSSK